MATVFKNFINSDITSTRTLLHESIPITGSIASGTYYIADASAVDVETNIKNYSHGLFQSVYDYPYLSSSANHIFDLTIGYHSDSDYSGTTGTRLQTGDKINMYNQMAQLLSGHDTAGNIRPFDRDGDLSGGDQMKEVFFVNFARLLTKDEIKKGSFKMQLITGSAANDPALYRKDWAGTNSAAKAVDCIDTAGYTSPGLNASFTITIPTSAGGLGPTAVTILLDEDQDGAQPAADNQISIGTHDGSESDILAAGYIIDAINGVSNSRVVYANAGTNGEATGTKSDLGVTAALGTNGTTEITLTMDTVGITGNITSALATATGVNIIDVTAFTGGSEQALLTLQDHNAVNAYKVNSPAGEYGLLYSASADALVTDGSRGALGHIYYQAGIAVVTASIFRSSEKFDDVVPGTLVDAHGENVRGTDEGYFGWLPGLVHGTDTLPTSSVATMFQSASISASCSGFRNALYNIEFNNTTELNSTIYFCRASHNEFNYSSNPTYLNASKIRVKETGLDQPVSYITTIGLYSADNELMAVAKLSEPIKKTPDNELTFRVRLDY